MPNKQNTTQGIGIAVAVLAVGGLIYLVLKGNGGGTGGSVGTGGITYTCQYCDGTTYTQSSPCPPNCIYNSYTCYYTNGVSYVQSTPCPNPSLSPPQYACGLPDVVANIDGSCPTGYQPDKINVGCCSPVPSTGGNINVTANPVVVGSGSNVTLIATIKPSVAGVLVHFYNRGVDIGVSYTNSSGIAKLVTSFINKSSSSINESITAQALVSSVLYTSNICIIQVQGVTQPANYGLGCDRMGFWQCVANGGSANMTLANCNLVYKDKIGTSCR